MSTIKPTSFRLRTYQVGFGDCFLLSFRYPPRKGKPQVRHVLIDFGSTGRPEATEANLMLRIAKNIAAECGDDLVAVVATHRHKDHISGFATNKAGTASGNLIASLKPRLIVQPWTEDPKAKPDAVRATQGLAGKKGFIASLSAMHEVAQATLRELDRRRSAFGSVVAKRLKFLGEDNLKNRSAIENLMAMGKAGTAAYVAYGSKSGLDKLLPGVKTTVLGPPTLEQTDSIMKQRAHDDAEFWHFQAAAGRQFTASGKSPFGARFHYAQRPEHVRWIIPRMDRLRGDQLLEIVRILDKQMNNTSVILLFEAGGKKLLFPGDAQIENWSYALEQAKSSKSLRKRLAAVNLYKVGHHGSLNATPKSLWSLFERKGTSHEHDHDAERLKTVVSTMAGKHGSADRGTEVPRGKLVDELRRKSDFFTTQNLKGKTLWHDVEVAF